MSTPEAPPHPAVLLERALVFLRTRMDQPHGVPPLWHTHLGKLELKFFPSMFAVQAVVLAFVALYAAGALLGRIVNRMRARAWLAALRDVLPSEFAYVHGPVWNGCDEAEVYASGRRGVAALHAGVALTPRHDPLRIAALTLYDMLALPAIPAVARDRAVLTFELPPGRPAGTFAVVAKHALRRVRHDRFDLAFARVVDQPHFSAQRGLDERFAVATEVADIADKWLGEPGARGDAHRAALGLVDTLNGAGACFESLVWTDQPATQPSEPLGAAGRTERLELTLALPATRAAAARALPLVAAALDVVDALAAAAVGQASPLALRPETLNTLRRTRAEVDEKLAEAAAAPAEDGARNDAPASRDMTPAEAERRRELEKKRARRKAQGAVRYK